MGPRERGAGFVVEDPLAMIHVSTFHDTEQRERSGSLQLEEGPQTCWREEGSRFHVTEKKFVGIQGYTLCTVGSCHEWLARER